MQNLGILLQIGAEQQPPARADQIRGPPQQRDGLMRA